MKRIPRFALYLMGFMLFLAMFRDLLANGRPLYCRINGQTYYPGLRTVFVSEDKPYTSEALHILQTKPNQMEVWKDNSNFDAPPVYAPIPFSPGEHSTLNIGSFYPPGHSHQGFEKRFVHWLGTDADGRDVAATIISGARIALMTGLLAMAVAFFLGLGLGMLAGYYGDDKLKINQLQMVLFGISIPIAWFYALETRKYQLSISKSTHDIYISLGIFLLIVTAIVQLYRPFKGAKLANKSVTVPADMLVMRMAEIFSSIPRLILVIVMAVVLGGLTKDSIWLMIALIGAFGWASVARFTRAELLKIRALDYIAAARGLGFSDLRILLKHALPNAARPLFIIFALGAGNAVLLEANLSFLGFGGTSFRGISWGSLLFNENRSANPLDSWWVTFFPGFMIFLTVFSLNRIGDALSDQNSN
jgi:peptide/nickel transport system permease protein